jgi:CubicO group peptidase (beta-lactamase class C family)
MNKPRLTTQDLADIAAFIDACLDQEQLGVVGMGVGVVQGGDVVFLEGAGRTRVSGQAAYTPATVQNIGSLSKAFISGTLAMLVDRGEIKWDRRVRDYLPEFGLADSALGDLVTVRDLTGSRIPAVWPLLPLPYSSDAMFLMGAGSSAYLARMRQLPVGREGFRTAYCYDGGFMNVGAIVVEAVTGRAFADVQHDLLASLGMHSTSLVANYDEREADHHQLVPGGLRAIASTFMRLAPGGAPAGGIKTCMADYVHWMRLHLGHGGDGVISRETRHELHRPGVTIGMSSHEQVSAAGYEPGPVMGYAMGWRVDMVRGHYSLFHGGSNPGIRTFVRLFPGLDLGVAVFQNSDANDYALARSVIDLVLSRAEGAPGEPLAARMAGLRAEVERIERTRAPVFEAPVPHVPATDQAHRYAGVYVIDGHFGGTVTVSAEEGGRLVMHSGIYTLELVETAEGRFRAIYLDDFLGPYYPSGGEFRNRQTHVEFCAGAAATPRGFVMSDGMESVSAHRAA